MNWNFYNKTPSKKSKKRNQKFSKIKKKEIQNFQKSKKEIKNSKKTQKQNSNDFITHLINYVCIEITLMFLYSFVL